MEIVALLKALLKNQSIDRLIYYAGWSDKFGQVFSSVNPVGSNHLNFSVPQAMGVVSVIDPSRLPRPPQRITAQMLFKKFLSV